jgi:predicted PhzF superfamily epimerase YddE/YHI9
VQRDQIEVFHTRVFSAGVDGGNRCPVVLFADRVRECAMQHLARGFGLDTVFIVKPRDRTADIRLRYFVPDHEMGISAHATIAAVTVGLLEGILRSDHIRIETLSGDFNATVSRNEETHVVLERSAPAYLARHDLRCRTGGHECRNRQGYAMGSPSLTEVLVDCAGGEVVRTALRGVCRVIRHESVLVLATGPT